MTLKRAELVERLKQLAESEPPKDLSSGALCYYPSESKEKIEIPCPNCKRAMIVGEKDEILRAYNISLKRIQNQGVEAKLIVPEHCPQCGFGLPKLDFLGAIQGTKFQLEIQYPDQPAPVRVELDTAYDLVLMYFFLQGEDRYDDGEKALKDAVARLRELFGIGI